MQYLYQIFFLKKITEFINQSEKPSSLSRLFVMCGHHLHVDLMRILSEMFNVVGIFV